MRNKTEWKIGAYVKLSRGYSWISQMSPIVSETSTQWKLKNGSRITKKRKSVVGKTETLASVMTQYEIDLHRAREKYIRDVHDLWQLVDRMQIDPNKLVRNKTIEEVLALNSSLAEMADTVKRHLGETP